MKVLIADDHAIVRKGLKQIIHEEYPQALIEEASNAEELIHKTMLDTWDVIITDLSMPGRSGLDALRQIRESFPKLPVLVLSMHPEDQYAIRVLNAGASGYINKDSAQEELIVAMNKVLNGKKYISSRVAEQMAEAIDDNSNKAPHETLSDREFDVLKMLASGKAVSEIADMLSLSSTTISTYRARILEKMKMKSNADITRYALENQLI
ncbi:MAG: response regulator transcription factor [Chitinophagaceae bacterium]|nr:response regulator transcription factor [Chitinophagaceae bacterium]